MEATQYNKQKAIIIGASGFGRELLSWNNISKNPQFDIIGFMDDNAESFSNYSGNNFPPLLGHIDFSKVASDTSVIMAISSLQAKEKIFQEMLKSGVLVASFFHETALINDNVTYGKGLVMFPYSLISCHCTLGDMVFINCGSQIGHDVIIGSNVSIMANVDIGGGAVIGNNVFIGSGATILPNVKIPDNVVIGAGSVVIRSIKLSGGTYFGNPASKIM